MAGRKKIGIYHYTEKGKFIRSYDSCSELREIWYDGTKFPLFTKSNIYHRLPNGDLIFKERVGRQKVIFYHEVDINIYTNRSNTLGVNKPVACYDLLGREIGRFRNIVDASTMTGYNYGTIMGGCKASSTKMPHNKNRVKFRYLSDYLEKKDGIN